MSIKAGDIAVIRTTGEKVYVLGIVNVDDSQSPVTVRRPCVAENGAVQHEVEDFELGELTTPAEYAQAKVDEMMAQRELQRQLLKQEYKITREVEQEAEAAEAEEAGPKVVPIN